MHVMVATDGSLDAERVADIVAPIAGADGRVTVFSAVEVPRGLLAHMRAAAMSSTAKLSEVSVEYRHDRAGDPPASHWIGDDEAIASFVRGEAADASRTMVAALEQHGVSVDVVGEEAEDAARAVLQAVTERGVDVLCVGPVGLGRFDGLLGSTSTKLARRAPCSVLIVR